VTDVGGIKDVEWGNDGDGGGDEGEDGNEEGVRGGSNDEGTSGSGLVK